MLPNGTLTYISVAAHEVGNVRCGRCEILLIYPLGAPAVKCSLCFFVTEIGVSEL
jgi:LSD1 subclass zinc finger protein